jgi:PAS domain S-box-containing protein
MKKNIKLKLSTKKHFVVLIAIITAVFVIGGIILYKFELNRLFNQKGKTLASIAYLKSTQVTEWFRDELSDIQLIADNPFLEEIAHNFIRTNSYADSSRLSGLLRQIRLEHETYEVILATTDGMVIASASEQRVELEGIEKKSIETAVNQGHAVSTDLFKCERDGDDMIFISFISVLRDNEKKPVASVVLRIDPAWNLYPLIENWPIFTKTAESIIFRIDADSITILNNLKHVRKTALDLKISITQADNVAIKAAMGATGIITGKDYRNIDVMSYSSRIEATPWFIISEIDRSEIIEETPMLIGRILGFFLLLILFSIAFVMSIYNNRQRNIFQQLYSKEKELWQQHEKFKITMDSLGDGVIITNMDAKVQYMNNRAEEISGWRDREAKGRILGEIYQVKNEETGEKENNILEKVIKHGIVKELANHTLLVSKNGEEIPVMDTGAPVYDADGSLTGIVITFQDETEKRTQSRLLKRSEERYRMLATNIPQKIFMKNCKLTYIYCNENFAEDLGITSDEIVGKTDFDFFPKELADKYRNDDRLILEKGETITLEEEYFVDGNPTWVRTTKTPVKDENGKVTGLLGIFEDITEKMRAQTALMKSQENLREFFENDITGDYSATAGGELIKCNPAFAGMLGFSSPDELVGRNIKDFYRDPGEREEFLKTIQVSKTLRNFEVILKHKDGSELFGKENIVGIFDESGSLVRYFGYLQDTTQQKEAEAILFQKEQLLSSVMDTQQDLICRFLPDTTLAFVNKAYCKLFGMTEEELFGRKFLELVPESDWEDIFSNLKRLNEENPQITYESSAFKADGSVITIEWTDIAIFNKKGEVVEFQSVGRDITEKLKTLNELIIAKEKAEESNRLKSAFLANLSHEIRTPLNGIIGFSELLKSTDITAEDIKMSIDIIEESGLRMLSTMNDLIDISKIEAGIIEAHTKEVDVNKKIEYACKLLEAEAVNKGLALNYTLLTPSAHAIISTDEDKLVSILVNLVKNAIKFTEKGKIAVGCKKVGSFIEFFVEDTGVGIPSDKQQKVFERFVQGDTSLTRGYEGSGLGLSISKAYVELLGGNIWVESEESKGSKFYFSIPCNFEKPDEMGENVTTTTTAAEIPYNLKILIAEDDVASELLLRRNVESYSREIITAKTGPEALQICISNPDIDLIFMDIKLPEMNGHEVTKRVRQFNPDVIIIAQTAYAQTNDRANALESGCNDYISKPILKIELNSILEKHFKICRE